MQCNATVTTVLEERDSQGNRITEAVGLNAGDLLDIYEYGNGRSCCTAQKLGECKRYFWIDTALFDVV